jgi:hypothetical protein
LPVNVELLLAVLLDLPPVAASSIDAGQPLFGALMVAGGGQPSFVLAVRLIDGREFVARVANGADAAFSAAPSSVRGLTLLRRKAPKLPLLAVLGNYLIVGQQNGELESAAPYLVRTLASRPLPSEAFVAEFSQTALAGPLTAAVQGTWQGYQQNLRELDRAQRDAKGRAPDFGDPAAVIAAADQSVRAVFDLLQTMKGARLVVTQEGEATALALRLELEPASGGFAERSIAELALGTLKPVLALPSETALALLLRSQPAEREALAKDAGLGLEQLLGARLAEKDREQLRRVLSGFHQGRGDASVYGLLPERTLFIASDATDPAKLQSAFHGLGRVLGLSAIKAPLREYLGDFSVQTEKRELSGVSVERMTFAPRVRPGANSKSVEAWFTSRGQSAWLTLGLGAQGGLAALLAADSSAPALRDDRELGALRAPALEDVALALYVNLARLGLSADPTLAAPALFVLRRHGRAAWLELSCSARAANLLASHWGPGR